MTTWTFDRSASGRTLGTKDGRDLYNFSGLGNNIICNSDNRSVIISVDGMSTEFIKMGDPVTIAGTNYPTVTTDNMKAIRDALQPVFLKANSTGGGTVSSLDAVPQGTNQKWLDAATYQKVIDFFNVNNPNNI